MLTAGDVADQAAAILNDSAKTLYTFAAQLPYLKKANEDLELLMVAAGVSVQRQTSAVLPVPSSSIDISIAPPQDMFVPIRVWERLSGSTDLFVLMDEKDWEPEILATQSLIFWAFRNNRIYFPPVSSNREIRIDYWRQLIPVSKESSTEEILLSKTYLAARTAELCARYVGENTDRADEIRDNEVLQAKDGVERVYIKNDQGNRTRRRRFMRSRTTYVR